ncbi:class I SAM-dependent methyltransferase [Metaclostridioides mangenotii]|uniref:class I SAM-dependent methyltransferase n=1 Tax=Metaclostridioides mangenotii TaxID=1540 RepID=UPI000ACC8FAC|nr:class I SAM-dependent methyltransferase [Clostridioides mangenotii]
MSLNMNKAYDKLYLSYKKDFEKDSPFNYDYERPALMKLLDESLTGKSILDAGCAGGWYTERFLELGAEVTSVDLNDNMIKLTKERVCNKAVVVNHDLSKDLPFEDDKFDIVVSSLTLHYLEDLDLVFSEFKRVLKSNGILLFSTHHPFVDMMDLNDKSYFEKTLIEDEWIKFGEKIKVQFYHRSLQDIINITTKYFSITSLVEPRPEASFKEKDPNNYNRLMLNPNFLIIKASNN